MVGPASLLFVYSFSLDIISLIDQLFYGYFRGGVVQRLVVKHIYPDEFCSSAVEACFFKPRGKMSDWLSKESINSRPTAFNKHIMQLI